MRSVFLLSALMLHVSWCYGYSGLYPWNPSFFNPFLRPHINGFKLEDIENIAKGEKVHALNEEESKPGATESSKETAGDSGSYYSFASSFTSSNDGGKLHSQGETVVNNNGKISKFKF